MSFLDLMAAVIAGNAVSLAYLYFIWRGTKMEKQGNSTSEMPWIVILMGIVPSGIVLASVLNW